MATSVIRRYWVDLDDMRVTSSLGERSPVSEIRLKARDSARIGFQFHRSGVPQLLAAGTVLTFGIKQRNAFGGDYLASVTSFTAATTINTVDFEDSDFYYGQLDLNTSEITTAIGTTEVQLLGMAELEIDISGAGQRNSTETIDVVILNDVNQGGEGTPTSADPPYPSASEVARWKPGVTSLTGGTSADLDSIPTTGLTPPYAVFINNQDVSANNWETWILKSSTSAENVGNGIVRPDDYNGTTNQKVWFRQSLFPAVDDSQVSAAASATNYTPSGSTVEGHLAGIDTAFGALGTAISNVVEDTSPQLGGNLDANGSNIDFDDNTGIRDDSGNEQLIFQKTASAVNHVEVTNAATGNAPTISAAGGDTNVSLILNAKGTGEIVLGATLDGNGNSIRLDDATGILDGNGNEVAIVSQAASAVNYLEFGNSATGTGPDITAAGSDTNINLLLVSKGTGEVLANGSRVITTAGVSGGQTLTGGTASGDKLILESTSNATKGGIQLAASNFLLLPEVSAPSTPSSGFGALYVSTAGNLYYKDDAGTATRLDQGAAARWETIEIPAHELGVYGGSSTASQDNLNLSAVTSTRHTVWSFDGSTSEEVYGILRIPDDWDSTTFIKAKIVGAGTSNSGNAVFGVAGSAATAGSAYAALGTEQTVTIPVTSGRHVISDATPAITFSGTPAAGKLVFFRLRRLPSDAADTLTDDFRVFSVAFQVYVKGDSTAW